MHGFLAQQREGEHLEGSPHDFGAGSGVVGGHALIDNQKEQRVGRPSATQPLARQKVGMPAANQPLLRQRVAKLSASVSATPLIEIVGRLVCSSLAVLKELLRYTMGINEAKPLI